MADMTNHDDLPGNRISRLLEKLKGHNAANDFGGLLAQKIEKPSSFSKGVPTLQQGIYRPASPMLTARFQFAGSWTYAAAGQTWLSPQSMEKAWNNKGIGKQLKLRKEHWSESVLNKATPDRVALFGIDREEKEETYLHFAEDASEPEIFQYVSNAEKKFANLEDYLHYLLE